MGQRENVLLIGIGTISNDLERPLILISHAIERRVIPLRLLSFF